MTVAREVMSARPTTISPDASMADAAQLRWTLDLRHLPVVDERGKLVGMLSDRDLRSLSAPYVVPEADSGQNVLDARVRDVMSADVLSVRPESDLTDVVGLMLENHVGAVQVVDEGGIVVGIVSYVDVLRVLAKEGGPRAQDIMSENPRTIGVNDSVGDALEALQSMEVRHHAPPPQAACPQPEPCTGTKGSGTRPSAALSSRGTCAARPSP